MATPPVIIALTMALAAYWIVPFGPTTGVMMRSSGRVSMVAWNR
jgi:hypothetical protein